MFTAKKSENKVRKTKKDRTSITNNLLFSNSDNPDVYFLVDEVLSEKQIESFDSMLRRNESLIAITYNIIYCLKVIPLETDTKSNIGNFYRDFTINLKDFIPEKSKVIPLGRAIYSITDGDTSINMGAFEDFIMNKTYFYAPNLDSYIFPTYYFQSFIGKDTFERFYTLLQIQVAFEHKIKAIRKITPVLQIVENVDEFLKDNLRDNSHWALDIETSGFDFLQDTIKCVTLCNSRNRAYYLRWKDIDVELFSSFCKNKKLLLAFGKFDLKFLIHNGVKRDSIKIYGDTYHLGHILNEMRSNSLKTHSWLYCSYGGYEKELDEYKRKYPKLKDYSKIPERILYKYACMDVIVTFTTFFEMKKQLDYIDNHFNEPNKWSLTDYYEKILIPSINLYVDIEMRGVYFDWKGLEKLSIKVKREIEEAKTEIKKEFNLISDIDTTEFFDQEYEYKEKDFYEEFTFEAKKTIINYNVSSNEQLAIFMEKANYPDYGRNKKGLYNVNENTLRKWEKDGYKGAELIIHLHRLSTIFNTFIGEKDKGTGYWKYYNSVTEKLHTTFGVMATNSGRNWCIAGGTKILVNRDYCNNPEGIPIEDIQVGDLVYSFDDNKKLVLNKVLDTFNNGYKEVLKIKYKSMGNKKVKELICTPNHKIRLYTGEYIEARELLNKKKGLHRLLTVHPDIKKDRLFIGGGGYKDNNGVSTYRFVYESLTGDKLIEADSIHHKDNNHKNHEFNNLQKMSKSEHSKFHSSNNTIGYNSLSNEGKLKVINKCKENHRLGKFSYTIGDNNPNFLKFDRFELIKEIFKAKGSLTKINHDFNTLKEKVKYYNIPLKEIQKRFSKKGIYLFKGKIEKTLLNNSWANSLKILNIGYYRLQDLLKYYNMSYYNDDGKVQVTYNNHYVIGVEKLKEKVLVFDLEVENDHNYIANEVCVHNCKNPNLQNRPERGYLAKELKALMICKDENQVKWELDYSGFQLRIGCILSGDKVMKDVFLNLGGDLHSMTGFNVLNNQLPKSMTFEEFIDLKNTKDSVPKIVRQKAKGINFQLEFGASAFNFAKTVIEKDWTLEECKSYIYKNHLGKKQKDMLAIMTGEKTFGNDDGGESQDDKSNIYDTIENKEDFSYCWVVAMDIRKKHFETYNGLSSWIEETKTLASENGYVKSVFGAFRRLPRLFYQGKQDKRGKVKNLMNISLNTGVQNFEIAVAHLSMIEVNNVIKEKGIRADIFNMVHDSCKFYSHKDDLELLKENAMRIFQQVRPEYKGIPIECD